MAQLPLGSAPSGPPQQRAGAFSAQPLPPPSPHGSMQLPFQQPQQQPPVQQQHQQQQQQRFSFDAFFQVTPLHVMTWLWRLSWLPTDFAMELFTSDTHAPACAHPVLWRWCCRVAEAADSRARHRASRRAALAARSRSPRCRRCRSARAHSPSWRASAVPPAPPVLPQVHARMFHRCLWCLSYWPDTNVLVGLASLAVF